jgi:hypothetical protein
MQSSLKSRLAVSGFYYYLAWINRDSMGRIKSGIIISVFSLLSAGLSAQEIIRPNQSLKSHETLEITSIVLKADMTFISLVVENRITGGTFCADRNVYIIDSEGTRLKLKKANGIPACPDAYKFRGIGEKLNFTLEFPPLKPGTSWIDIIEECSSDCFWFYGVTLDNELNRKLDQAFLAAAGNKPADNVTLFKNILDPIDSQNLGIEGLLYINIINASLENADKVGASVWYKRLAASDAPRVNQYLKYLNDLGIKY